MPEKSKPVTTEQQKNYSKKYYLRNADEIRRQRSERYHNDPAYRDRVKQRVAEGRKQKTKKREDAVEKMITDDSGIPVQDGLAHPRIYRIVHPKGDRSATALMYPIGYVARACGCSPQNIRKMEHEGTIPAPLFKSSGGGRIYTEDQIAVIAHHYTRLRFEKAANGRAKINKKGDRISVQSLRHLRAAIAQDWDLLINGLKPERFHPTPTDPHKTEEQDHG